MAALGQRRVLHVVNHTKDVGNGITNVAVDLACQQALEGDSVAIAANPGAFDELLRSCGVEVINIDFESLRSGAVLRATRDLRRLIRTANPHVVHAHTLAATVVARVAALGARTRVVATVHNEYQRGVILMAAAHRVVGPSAAVSERMRRRGVPRRKLSTVLNGTVGSARRKTLPPAAPIHIEQPAIVTVGAVSHRKGADRLVAMAQNLAASHGAHMHFAGPVHWDEPRTTAQASDAAENIHFLGFTADPRPLLAEASVFVIASRRDPAPLVVIEALEAGLPVVATAVDGIPELLGDAGILVPPDDVEALTAAVQHVLDSDTARRRLSTAALDRAQELTVERVIAEYRDVYDSLIRQ